MYIEPKNNDEILANKEEFISIVKEKCSAKQGIDKLMEWLEKTDFYYAPASTKYHEAYPGGLCEHSLVVYYKLLELSSVIPEEHKLSEESMAIVALFHDLCKANFYKEGTRNVKNEQTGQWESVKTYSVDDQFPFGHGEKSVFLLSKFINLTVLEAVTIRCHMGFSDDSFKGGSYLIGNAFEKYPAAVPLHTADLMATYLKLTNQEKRK